MALVKTKGLIIREQPFQDQDKLLTIFTEKEGKQRAIAKGVRRRKSALVAATQLFAFSEFVYYPGKNFASINEANLIESFYPLRQDVGKMTLSSYLLELLDAFFDLYQGNPSFLKMTTHCLYYISEKKATCDEALVAAFQLKLLEVQGIGPVLDRCVRCGKTTDLTAFSVEESGFLCGDCARGGRLPESLRETMITLLNWPVKKTCYGSWDRKEILEIMGLLNRYIVSHLNRRLKSYDFFVNLI